MKLRPFLRGLLLALLAPLLSVSCSLTEKVPAGEQLYTGIRDVNYTLDTPLSKQRNTATADSAGVITSIANAVDAVERAMKGGGHATPSLDELRRQHWDSLTSAQRERLLTQEKNERTNIANTKTEIDAVLAYPPNGALFGSTKYTTPWKFGLWTYNHFVDSKSVLGKWFFNTFGEAPILVSNVAPQTRAKIATGVLRNHGYLRGRVDYQVITGSNPKKAKIDYDITPGRLFFLDSIAYLGFDATADSLLSRTRSQRLLRSGDAFSSAALAAEQSRIETLMRNNGYDYFSAAHTTFLADTVAHPGYVQLQVRPAAQRSAAAQRPWYMGHVYVTIRDDKESNLTGRLDRRGYTFFFPGNKIPLQPGLWRRSIQHTEGERFAAWAQKATVEHLYGLGIFSSMDVNYAPRDSSFNCDTLDVHVSATLAKPYDSSLEMSGTYKSNEQIGPGLSYELSKHNAFRGAETVSWKLFGSYEWQLGESSSALNSYELGSQLSFKFPRLIMPWFNPTAMGRRYRRRIAIAQAQARLLGQQAPFQLKDFTPVIGTTTVSLTGNWRNRSGFFTFVTFGGNLNYKWYTNPRKRHELNLFNLEYNSVIRTTAAFDSITRANPALYISMRDQFVPSVSYTFTSSAPAADRHPYWVQFMVKEAGNLTSTLYSLTGRSFTESGKRLLGSPFSQFVKVTAEGHYTHVFSSRLSLAMRAFAGAVYAFGNSTYAPYGEQFYVGGANSVRGFAVRTIGPGGYHTPRTKYSYIDQTGDFKLEANAELRTRLFGQLNGALFLDAGNVWLIRPDARRSESALTLRNMKRIAVGTGMGLRYDLSFLVIRIDLGVGLHAPYDTNRRGFYNIERFRESLVLHFAVGYPF